MITATDKSRKERIMVRIPSLFLFFFWLPRQSKKKNHLLYKVQFFLGPGWPFSALSNHS